MRDSGQTGGVWALVGMDAWDEHGGGNERDEGQEAGHPPHLPAPWERDDYLPAEGEEGAARRARHDAFTPERRVPFLKRLAKTGCILDACRAVGVSSRTVYRLQERDPEFMKHCELALAMARTPVELAAWERGVVGIEEDYVRGGQVYTRVKRSDSILRLLLQGADRKKYGPRPGFTRKRLLKLERKQIEKEVRAEIRAKMPSFDDAMAMLEPKLAAFGAREDQKKIEEGWTKTEEGHMIPPGWVRLHGAEGLCAGEGGASGEPSEKSDSV